MGSSTSNLYTQGNSSLAARSTTGDLTKQNSISTLQTLPLQQQGKKVRWDKGVRVVLIPTCEEYREVGLANSIWWNEADYAVFRDSAAEEIQEAMKLIKINIKEAVKILYQPENEWKCQKYYLSGYTLPKLVSSYKKNKLSSSLESELMARDMSTRDDSLRQYKKRYDGHHNNSNTTTPMSTSNSANNMNTDSNTHNMSIHENTLLSSSFPLTSHHSAFTTYSNLFSPRPEGHNYDSETDGTSSPQSVTEMSDGTYDSYSMSDITNSKPPRHIASTTSNNNTITTAAAKRGAFPPYDFQ